MRIAAGAEVQAYLQDAQNFYIAHVYQESSSQLILYNWDNMYWAGNVFMAQLTDEGAQERSRQDVSEAYRTRAANVCLQVHKWRSKHDAAVLCTSMLLVLSDECHWVLRQLGWLTLHPLRAIGETSGAAQAPFTSGRSTSCSSGSAASARWSPTRRWGLASNVNGPSLTNTQVSVQASACVNMCHNKELASYTRQT